MKRILKVTLISILVLGILLYITAKIVLSGVEFGGEMDEISIQKAKNSPQFVDDHFQNKPDVIENDLMVNWNDMRGNQIRKPPKPFPGESPLISDTVGSGIKATWIGHATVYIEMDGKRIMTDPMMSVHAFPIKMVAPERYNPTPIKVNELPKIDIVTISHDHFDHLDMKTIIALGEKGTHFYVGIGIKAHLVKWEIPENQIHEMDWWESVNFDDFTINCTPARHYSGRTGMNNSTLWTSWVITSPYHKIYHSGDSGYEAHFKEIGEKFGSIDIGFIKVGDYGLDLGWRDIHMHTEKSVQAAKDINAKLMFPIHWGTFDLSNHDWFEPINLAVEFSEKENVALVTPKIGQTINYRDTIRNDFWWKKLEEISINQIEE